MNRSDAITALRRLALWLQSHDIDWPKTPAAAVQWDAPAQLVDALVYSAPVAPERQKVMTYAVRPERLPLSQTPRRPGAYLIGLPPRWYQWGIPEQWSRWVDGRGFFGIYGSFDLAMADPHPEDQAEQSPVHWRDVIVEWV